MKCLKPTTNVRKEFSGTLLGFDDYVSKFITYTFIEAILSWITER